MFFLNKNHACKNFLIFKKPLDQEFKTKIPVKETPKKEFNKHGPRNIKQLVSGYPDKWWLLLQLTMRTKMQLVSYDTDVFAKNMKSEALNVNNTTANLNFEAIANQVIRLTIFQNWSKSLLYIKLKKYAKAFIKLLQITKTALSYTMVFSLPKLSIRKNYFYIHQCFTSIWSHIVKFIWLLLESDNLKV